MLAFVFPPLDPVAVSFGPLVIRWYALAYLTGILLGWVYAKWLVRRIPGGPDPLLYDDYLTWLVLGIVLGGRVGYVLFYQGSYYLANPLEALEIWHGGMSFHGGALGVIVATLLFCRKHKLGFFRFIDPVACVVPIGLGCGRLANFVNGELFGRVTDMPWGVIFPRGGDQPRHPSQLYEAGLEGLILLLILFLFARSPKFSGRHGFLSGVFLAAYGSFRFTLEFFREPDAQLGFLYGGATMGQLLCLPMLAYGGYLIVRALRRPPIVDLTV